VTQATPEVAALEVAAPIPPPRDPLTYLSHTDRAVLYAVLTAWVYEDDALSFLSENHKLDEKDLRTEVFRIVEVLTKTHLDIPGARRGVSPSSARLERDHMGHVEDNRERR
jgi:hypothetical protein